MKPVPYITGMAIFHEFFIFVFHRWRSWSCLLWYNRILNKGPVCPVEVREPLHTICAHFTRTFTRKNWKNKTKPGILKARTYWPMDANRMQKGHTGRPNFRGWRHPFSSAPKIDKTVENLRKQNGKERTRGVCSRNVKQMNIGPWRIEEDNNSEGVIGFNFKADV